MVRIHLNSLPAYPSNTDKRRREKIGRYPPSLEADGFLSIVL